MYERLKSFRESLGMTQAEFSKTLGLAKTTYNNYETGIREPKSDFWTAIAQTYDVTIDYLMGFSNNPYPSNKVVLSIPEETHIKKYRTLDGYGKDIVDTVLDKESARCTAQKARAARCQTEESAETGAESALYYFPIYESPMSAGTGQLAGQEYPQTTPLIKKPPHGASYIAPVSGDSMEPTYSDGDLLFIHATPDIEPGQIGVFLMGGEQYVKELGDGELISHNEEYEPIPMTEDITCQGLVLGVCDESYFQ